MFSPTQYQHESPKNRLQFYKQSKQGQFIGQILHKRATTAHAIRQQIQEHKGAINSIAKKFNID